VDKVALAQVSLPILIPPPGAGKIGQLVASLASGLTPPHETLKKNSNLVSDLHFSHQQLWSVHASALTAWGMI
jgi:hypothetical protein